MKTSSEIRSASSSEQSRSHHDEGVNGRQSKILDPESSGITSESKILLCQCSGITSDMIPLHWQSSGDYWQSSGIESD